MNGLKITKVQTESPYDTSNVITINNMFATCRKVNAQITMPTIENNHVVSSESIMPKPNILNHLFFLNFLKAVTLQRESTVKVFLDRRRHACLGS